MSIPALKRAATGSFYVHWSEGKRSKRQSLFTTDLGEAQRRFATWLTHKDATPEEGAKQFTIGDLWDAYYKKHGERETAAPELLRTSWKNLEQHFGTRMLSDLSDDSVAQYVAKRRAGKIGRVSQPATVRRELLALITCFNWCANRKKCKPPLIVKTDIPDIELPPAAEPRDRWLRRDEIDKLLAAAAEKRVGGRLTRMEVFLWLALETAARKQAIYDLTWERVDFETGMIHYAVPGKKRTKKRRVSVPISKTLRPVLERAFAERADQDRTDGHVLDEQIEVWHPLQTIAKRARIGTVVEGSTKTGIGPHTLRHTAATHMARRGVPLFTIAGVLGNTVAMVERVYAKHQPESLQKAVDMISGD